MRFKVHRDNLCHRIICSVVMKCNLQNQNISETVILNTPVALWCADVVVWLPAVPVGWGQKSHQGNGVWSHRVWTAGLRSGVYWHTAAAAMLLYPANTHTKVRAHKRVCVCVRR